MVPLIVNPLTPNNTREEWALAFYVLGAIMVGCNIFYCFFASAELQPWATVQVGTFVFIVYCFTNFQHFRERMERRRQNNKNDQVYAVENGKMEPAKVPTRPSSGPPVLAA